MGAATIRLPDAVSERLQKLAQRTGCSKTFYMPEAIREQLDGLEELYLAEQRLTDNRVGKAASIALADVMKRYGGEGKFDAAAERSLDQRSWTAVMHA